MENITAMIENLGFPIVCVIVMGFFIYRIWDKQTSTMQQHFEENLKRSIEREEKLSNEIRETREINSKAIDTIARYSEKLDSIQTDINGIKNNLTILTAKV